MGGRVALIPIGALQARWWWEEGVLGWHFDQFCRNGEFTPTELWGDVLNKRRQLWVAQDTEKVKAACLTMVVADGHKTFAITHCAGEDRGSWLPFLDNLEVFARQIGCGQLRIIPRPGYERELGHMGLRKTHVIMEKAL